MIDIIIATIIGIICIIGYRRGFIWQVLMLLRMIGMIIFILVVIRPLSGFIVPYVIPFIHLDILNTIPEPYRMQMIVFILSICISIITICIVQYTTKKMVNAFHGKTIRKIPIVGKLNSVLGLIIAFIQCLVVSVGCIALLSFSGAELFTYIYDESLFVHMVYDVFPVMIDFITSILKIQV